MSAPDTVGPLFERVLERFKRVSRKRPPAVIIEEANTMFLKAVKKENATKSEIAAIVK